MLKTLQKNFRVRPLTAAVASIISLTAGSMAYAQDDAEEIVVTGIKASLQAAMDIKRDSAGVVDAISAEDMGKFPDTNLAESLQRITGVSIDRQNGEGSKVTVRGFGDQNNMITLNGRTLPAAGVYGGGGTSSSTDASRGFDFANLASESVAGVQVYKTGKANVAAGGIGATINIQTAKPLDTEGFKASVGAKALNDTTNRTGDDITPELSGIVSWSDGTFGAALSGSHQERDSGASSIWVNEWNISRWAVDHEPNAVGQITKNRGLYQFSPTVKMTNQPEVGQLYGRPNDIRYIFSDTERTRENAQLTLQWAITDKVTSTLDYTYAQNDLMERRGESTSWIDNNGASIDEIIFDGNKEIATPLYIHETRGPRDQGYEQQLRNQTNTLTSLGFNTVFEATDSLTLNFDIHKSKMDSLPSGPGGSSHLSATIGTPTQISHSLDFRADAPLFTMVNDDSRYRDANANGAYDAGEVRLGNNNGIYDAGDVGSQIVRIYANAQINEITEARIGGEFKFDEGHFDFGVETRAMENTIRSNSEKAMTMGNWGIARPGDIPADLIQNFDYAGMFDDFATSKSFHGGFKANAEDLAASLVKTWKVNETATNPFCVCVNPILGTNSVVEEDTDAAYVQLGLKGEFAGFPTNFLVGLRYETTDVTSSALVIPLQQLYWDDNNDFFAVNGTNQVTLSVDADYDYMLPNMDFDIALTDDIKARASFSQTIARAGYGAMNAAASGYSSGGGSTALGSTKSATAGNPALLPLESSNTDISLEWYYDDSSYVSVGVFEKRVKNFIGNAVAREELFGIQDQTSATSPRIVQALSALRSIGVQPDDTRLFTMQAILNNPDDFPGGAADYLTKASTLAQQDAIAANPKYNMYVRSDDPLAQWSVTRPRNNRAAKLYGAEFAAQHFFGDSGFGFQANYTIVRGDIKYINNFEPRSEQFALLGLSDTANVVAIYEKNDLQARIAYNWRGEFLRSSTRNTAQNPIYVEAYSQIDANVSYNLTEDWSVSVEALNLLGADTRQHGRTKAMMEEMYDLGPRYTVGTRYNF